MLLNKKFWGLFILFAFLLNLQINYAQGRFSKETEAKIKNKISQIEIHKNQLASNEKKVESLLRVLINKMKADNKNGILEGKYASKKYTTSSAKVNENLQVEVVITLLLGKDSDSSLVKSRILNIGGNTRLTIKPSASMPVELYSWVPYGQILEIAKITSIGNISALGSPIQRIGDKLTQGYSQLYVDKAREYFNVDGTGIKVGVISTGVKDINNSINSHDLPPINDSQHILNAGNTSDNEGTAMLEIVHDLAPGAELYFAGISPNEGPNDMANRVNQLANAGCNVIVDDIGWPYPSPQFSEDYLFNTIYNYKNNPNYNRSYISAAGNDGKDSFDGMFYPNVDNYNIWWQANGQSYIDNSFNLQPNENVDIILQWADKWDYSRTDYDLYVADQFGNIFDSSVTVQGTQGSIPREEISFSYDYNHTPPYYVRVKLDTQHTPINEPNKEIRLIVAAYNGPPTEIDYQYANYPSNPGRATGQIYGKEMVSTIPVGAYPVLNQNVLEDFSSRGPSKLYSFDSNGNQTGVIIYNTPAVIATDGVETNAGSEFNPFFGTSAAAPHIAGIAALYYSKFSNGNFYNSLTSSASSIAGGTGGVYNDQSGFGKADARECLIYSLTSISPGTISSNTNWTNVKVNGTVTINSGIVVTVPSNSTAVVIGTVNFVNSNSRIVVNTGGTLLVRENATVDPAHVTGNVIFEGGVLVRQVTENQSVLSGYTFGRWEGGPTFQSYIGPKNFLGLNIGDTQVYQANQEIISNQKYNIWKVDGIADSSIMNHHPFQIQNIPSTYTAQFYPTYSGVTIQNSIEGTSVNIGSIAFKDPWLIDYADPGYGNNLRNRGMSAPFKTMSSPFIPDYTTSFSGDVYKGVFLNQNPNFLPNLPNYSVSVQSPQTIYLSADNKDHTFYFQNWSVNNSNYAALQNPNSSSTAVVFNNTSAIVTANLKGTQLSNNVNSYANNSQRKVVRTTNGYIHQVYESLGKVWYERSTDNGATWDIMNGGQPLDSGSGKLPAIDYYGNV
ncbi:MAG: hypothetical protein CO128_08360, partial [Ignavibacteriales bacterium CG_4_9_14_3_um_filter_30_11]